MLNEMKYNEAIINRKVNGSKGNGCGLHNFIFHYANEYKYELLTKLGLKYRKFKDSGGDLHIISQEIEFNYSIKFTRDLIIKIKFLEFYDDRIQVMSKIYNSTGSLVATAITTYLVLNTRMKNKNINDYFKIMENDVEELVSY
jgi:acyl-CoA thioesterase FadM